MISKRVVAGSVGHIGDRMLLTTWRDRPAALYLIQPLLLMKTRVATPPAFIQQELVRRGFAKRTSESPHIPDVDAYIGLKSGVSLWFQEPYGREVQFKGSPAHPPRGWVNQAEKRGVILMISVVDPPTHNVTIDDVMALPTTVVGKVRLRKEFLCPPDHLTLDPSMKLLTDHMGYPPLAIMPDANVLIEVEQFYRGRFPVDDSLRRDRMRSTLMYLSGQASLPVLALMESTRSSDGLVVDQSSRDRMLDMWAAISACTPEQIADLFRNPTVIPEQAMRNFPRALLTDPGPSLENYELRMIHRLVIPTYAMILRMMQLTPPSLRFQGPKDKLRRWESFIDWIQENDVPASGVAVAAISQWFLLSHRPMSNVEHLRWLFKFKPGRLPKNARGAAWDIILVNHLLTNLKAYPPNNLAILTSDRSLPLLWDQIRGIKETSSSWKGGLMVNLSMVEPSLIPRFDSIQQKLLGLERLRDAQDRYFSTWRKCPSPRDERIFQLALELEREVYAGIFADP